MSEHASGATIGIDLGTTFSLAAAMDGGRSRMLENALGETLTPSAVAIDPDGEVLVGAPALARRTTRPETAAVAFKRDMGTDRVYRLADRELRPQQLSALVLRALKRDAETALGKRVESAVVTVPAYFDHRQRMATREACGLAGLAVERLLNEPTAAALAYGLHRRDRELRAVVLDLGGGTCDVTVLEIIEGVIEIQSSAGDSRLGGEDFVDSLVEHATARSPELARAVEAFAVSRQRLRRACEDAKRRLSARQSTSILLPELAVAEGEAADVELELTRVEAEELWQPLLARVERPVHRALGDAGLRGDQIDEVLLVGGSTRMPCVVGLAARLFGRMPSRELPADEAVAMGAAVQAALLDRDEQVEDLVVTDVAPFTLGIAAAELFGSQIVGDVFTPILERGTVIPASRVRGFSTLHDFQEEIRIQVYQGEHSLCSDNTFLGDYVVRGLPLARAGEADVTVRFTYDLNGLLEVETTVLASGEKQVLVIENSPSKMKPEEIDAARDAMRFLKFDPREALPNTTALARGEELYLELTGAARERLGLAMTVFRAALETQDDQVIERCRVQLLDSIELFRGERGLLEE